MSAKCELQSFGTTGLSDNGQVADPLADATARYRRAVDDISKARIEAKQQVEAAKKRRDAAREALAERIVAAVVAGRRQNEITQVTGYSRERVRQICRTAGVEAE